MLEAFEGVAESLDERATLWRFMDFTKYVAMLHRRALFFARADEMPDPFEGLYGRRTPRDYRTQGRPDVERLRERVLLSCWHENEHESAAMWRIYLSAEDGVAIRSSVARLREALATAAEPLIVGRVQYVDRRPRVDAPEHELAPFFCKRKSFEYEREVRALRQEERAPDKPGRYVTVDVAKLIDAVVIAPAGQPWLRELVSSVTEKYGLRVPIVGSTLLEPPDAEVIDGGSSRG